MSAELCGLLNLDKSSISRVVKKLVEAGELEEEFDGGAAGKGDGRVKRLVLTAKGKETVRGIDVGILVVSSCFALSPFLGLTLFLSHLISISYIRAELLNVTMSLSNSLFSLPLNVRLNKKIHNYHNVPS